MYYLLTHVLSLQSINGYIKMHSLMLQNTSITCSISFTHKMLFQGVIVGTGWSKLLFLISDAPGWHGDSSLEVSLLLPFSVTVSKTRISCCVFCVIAEGTKCYHFVFNILQWRNSEYRYVRSVLMLSLPLLLCLSGRLFPFRFLSQISVCLPRALSISSSMISCGLNYYNSPRFQVINCYYNYRLAGYFTF